MKSVHVILERALSKDKEESNDQRMAKQYLEKLLLFESERVRLDSTHQSWVHLVNATSGFEFELATLLERGNAPDSFSLPLYLRAYSASDSQKKGIITSRYLKLLPKVSEKRLVPAIKNFFATAKYGYHGQENWGKASTHSNYPFGNDERLDSTEWEYYRPTFEHMIELLDESDSFETAEFLLQTLNEFDPISSEVRADGHTIAKIVNSLTRICTKQLKVHFTPFIGICLERGMDAIAHLVDDPRYQSKVKNGNFRREYHLKTAASNFVNSMQVYLNASGPIWSPILNREKMQPSLHRGNEPVTLEPPVTQRPLAP